SPALWTTRRIVRAGFQRTTGARLRLQDAAHRTERLDVPRTAGPQPHAHLFPRVVLHDKTVAAVPRGTDLPFHKQEERRVHPRRGRLVGGASGFLPGARRSTGGG